MIKCTAIGLCWECLVNVLRWNEEGGNFIVIDVQIAQFQYPEPYRAGKA